MRQFYGSAISKNMIEKPQGDGVVLICQNVPIARTGGQQYRESEVRVGGDPTKVVTLKRLPEDVSDPAAVASFEGSPITDEHTPAGTDVVPENYAMYQKGHLQNVRWIDVDGGSSRSKPGQILADFYITDPTLQQEVRSNIKREVSCGYRWKPKELPDGQIATTMIRANHVAVVKFGKAGAACRINDAQTVPPDPLVADDFLPVLYDAMPLCMDTDISLTLSDGATPPELSTQKGTRMKTNSKPGAIGSFLRALLNGARNLQDSAAIEQTVEDALPAAHAAFLADCDDLEDGKTAKAHKEPDADNNGGPSDGDADNKMKAQDAKITALTDTVTALQKQLTDAMTALSAAATATVNDAGTAAAAATLTDADKALAQLDKLIGADATASVQDAGAAQVFSPAGNQVQSPLSSEDRLAILKDMRAVVNHPAVKANPELQKMLTDKLLVIGGYNADTAAQTMANLAASSAAHHAVASFAGQGVGATQSAATVQAALDALDPTK